MLVLLVAFSQFMSLRSTKDHLATPYFYWATAAHTTRTRTAELFEKWIEEKKSQKIRIKLDSANAGFQKSIIQGVTGVASDVIDNLQGKDVHFLQQVGMLEDITELWKKGGEPSDNFYPQFADDSFIDGKRYAYNGNADITMVMVNKDAFKKLGLPLLTYRNDVETFEKAGRAFTVAANKGLKHQDHFFLGSLTPTHLRRTKGVSHFNETLTKAALNLPETIETMKIYKKWIYEYHLIPTVAEMASFNVEDGIGSADFQLFYKGNIAMIFTGRWSLMQIRNMGPGLDMTVIEPPNAGYPTAVIGGREIVLYKGSANKELAKYFFMFLSSETYNRYIIECGDSFPPNPAFLDSEELLHPKKYTNEWELQQNFVKGFKSIGQGREYSPYAAASVYLSKEGKIYDAYLSGVISAEEAAKELDEAVNEEIRKQLQRHPELQSSYQASLLKQKQIDEIKKAGKKIPADLIDNTFLKRFYRDTGRLEE
jgi:multiple sugar transport system substrate-binding protein